MIPTAFFSAVLAASWQGSLVIAPLLAARPLLGRWIPARWLALLGTLAILRLLVPAFLLPPSPASWEHIAAVRRPLEKASQAFDRAASFPMTSGVARQQPLNNVDARAPAIIPAAKSIAWSRAAAVIWAIGCALTALWVFVGTIRLQRRLRRDSREVDAAVLRVWERCCDRVLPNSEREKASARPTESRSQIAKMLARLRLPTLCPPRLVQTSAVASPALVGLFRPLLLIPHRAGEPLSAQDWEHIFYHELAHFRRRDHWLQALQLLALVVHWFNPLVWLVSRVLRADRELAADEWALCQLTAERPAAYAATLLKVLAAHAHRSLAPGLVGILEDRAQLQQRLRRIVAFTPHRPLGSVLGLLLVASLGAVILTVAQAQVEALRGWSVVSVAIPKDGELRDAYVDLKSPAGRAVTLTQGVTSQEGVLLAKLDWSGTPVRVAVTLQKGEERVELTADSGLVSKNNALLRRTPHLEIESKFIEVPDAIADAITFPTSGSFMDKYGAAAAPAPSSRALSLRAVLSEPEAEQFLVKLLAPKDGQSSGAPGFDVLAAPRVTTRARQRAVVEIIRELRYPSDWNEPDASNPSWTPKAFETRNCGVTLEVEPTLGEGEVIDLKVTPQIVEFLGFVDFETRAPIFAAQADPSKTALDRTFRSVMGFQPINRPTRAVFSTRKSLTEVSIPTGHTLVLIGSGEAEDISPFESPSKGRQLIVLIRASRVVLPSTEETPPLAPPSPTPGAPASPPAAAPASAPTVTRPSAPAETAQPDLQPAAGNAPPDAAPANDQRFATLLLNAVPAAQLVRGKPGFVTSPHAPAAGYIDVRGFPAGTEVKCPYSGKMFRIP